MLTRHPDAYLYGSLAEVYAYLLDEQRANAYMQRFTMAINEIKIDEERANYARRRFRSAASISAKHGGEA